ERKLLGEAAADRKALTAIEAIEGALLDVVGDLRQLGQVGTEHAAHDHSGRIEWRRSERLAFDQRRSEINAVKLADPISNRGIVGQRGCERLDQKMTIEPKNLRQQLLTEAVHNRHDDDQGR